ncbi:RNA-binding protein [Coleofasciculus sp. FACHB-1120]|uniref:RNA recognition motif domain-containing protein n=1 Tax=Coleofasciculus sp. FACHB-1120 TaxID=2692783 RepID=UPI001689ACD1|nr:RNA-binding protein [Coleofasciculus sp. FACHB-1120]MBD2740975.1 RNA-binding protein [Coleofasciculus sp. FACHB-1120]
MSIRLYVGNLPKEEVDRQELQALFGDMSDSVSTKVIKDRKTGKCRGFAFVTVKTDELADEIIEKFNGQMFQESPLKIEKALPRAKGEGEEEPRPAAPAPIKESDKAAGGGGGSAPAPTGGGGRRGGSNKKSRRSEGSTSNESDTFQPDPRWAGELAKLKELLAAQSN